jgi:hypothetical protein
VPPVELERTLIGRDTGRARVTGTLLLYETWASQLVRGGCERCEALRVSLRESGSNRGRAGGRDQSRSARQQGGICIWNFMLLTSQLSTLAAVRTLAGIIYITASGHD